MKGKRKVLGRAALGLSVLGFGVVIGAYVVPASPQCHTRLDRAILTRVDRGHLLDIADVLARVLPTEYRAAVAALKFSGFRNEDRMVGATYRRRAVPEPNEVNREEREAILHFNRLLDEHDAVLVKKFTREIPQVHRPDVSVTVYMFGKQNGRLTFSAQVADGLPLPWRRTGYPPRRTRGAP